MDEPPRKTYQLLKVSSNRSRIEVLKLLEKEEITAKNLAEILGISDAYIHKHLNRLNEEGLIKKEGKRFAISTSGRIFINLLDGITVIERYRDLWESHNVDKVPKNLLRWIGVLNDTEIICSAPRVFEKFYSTILNRKKRILIAIDRFPIIVAGASLRELIKKRDKGEIKRYWLIGPIPHFRSSHPNFKLPPGLEMRSMPLEGIYLGVVIVDEREAIVIFPDSKGTLDWDYAIYGTDPDFISWAEKNFWKMYTKGENIWG